VTSIAATQIAVQRRNARKRFSVNVAVSCTLPPVTLTVSVDGMLHDTFLGDRRREVPKALFNVEL